MEKFKLIVDRKVEVWRRDRVTIEAESLEEATNKAFDEDYLPDESEYLYETEGDLDLNSDRHCATIEVMDEGYNVLKDNCN